MNIKKTLGLAGNFMDVDESIYALEELGKELGYSSQAIFIAIRYLKKLKKYEAMVDELESNFQYYWVRDAIRQLKQEYFPEPEPEDTADRFILDKIEEAIKNFLQDIYHIRVGREVKERNKKGGISC